jgi:dihydroorotate dehydrogenase (NAD+) catalytic subunit
VTVDLAAAVGEVRLPNPVLTASGTAGHGAELQAYGELSALGAVVVKSLSAQSWPGNPAPRVHPAAGGAGMLNSVGLQGPGVAAWLADDLPALEAAGARVVASLWGRTVEEYADGARLLAAAGAAVVAVEVNLSCPNLDGGRHLFAQSPADSAAVITAVRGAGGARPVWAKLTAATSSVVDVAEAVAGAGAAAVTLVNTLLGMVIDVERRAPVLGAGGGGLSGAAIHPVAVRTVHDVHAALPALPIVGVGGIGTGVDAIELLLAGASAVQVGTATFADPRACWRVLDEVGAWCRTNGVPSTRDLTGAAHAR